MSVHDGAEVGGELIAALIAFDSDGFDRDESGVGLPGFLIPAAGFQLFDEDGVAVADDV